MTLSWKNIHRIYTNKRSFFFLRTNTNKRSFAVAPPLFLSSLQSLAFFHQTYVKTHFLRNLVFIVVSELF